jgi:hypothetical protein
MLTRTVQRLASHDSRIDPTQAEIDEFERRKREIQDGWSRRERAIRRGVPRDRANNDGTEQWTPPGADHGTRTGRTNERVYARRQG